MALGAAQRAPASDREAGRDRPVPTIVAILLVDAARLGLAWRRWPGERTRVLGFVASLAALCLLALEVGLGRSGFGPGAGLAGRYATLAAPAMVHAYLVWELYGPRAQVVAGRAALAALLVLLVPANVLTALGHGQGRRSQADPFERDLRAGLPAELLGQLSIRDTIDQLRIDPDARLGTFRLLEGVLLLAPRTSRRGGA